MARSWWKGCIGAALVIAVGGCSGSSAPPCDGDVVLESVVDLVRERMLDYTPAQYGVDPEWWNDLGERIEAADKKADDLNWAFRYQNKGSEAAVAEAYKELRALEGLRRGAGEAVRDRALEDALEAEIELRDIIVLEQDEELRWSFCKTTAVATVDAEPEGMIGDVRFVVSDRGRRRIVDVEYEAIRSQDAKLVRVRLGSFRLHE